MNYSQNISKKIEKEFKIASEARKNGFEFSEEPEIYIAKDVAEKVEGLTGIDGIAETIRKIKKQSKREEEVAFKLAEEIIKKETNRERAADKAIRASLAFITQGAVAAPLEGIAKVRIRKNPDDTEYLSIYYAGPIRAAGGTAEALSVIVADYVRNTLGLGEYKPTLREIGRYVEEIQWYHRHVHLQYMPTEDEIRTIVRNVPICIDGEPTEEIEVANYRDLGRVETNRIRGGMCLVLAEGIAQKAQKLLKRMKPIEKKYGLDWAWLEGLLVKKASKESKKFREKLEEMPLPGFEWVTDLADESVSDLSKIIELTDKEGRWDWMEEALEEETERGGSKKYIHEIPAGRPVFAHPSRKGGFALRYGRTRASGYAAVALNPATMHILDDFVAIGTQIRLELPGKAAIVTPCDTINGPIVKLKNKEVLQINNIGEANKYKDETGEILHLGDILISVGDFLENNHELLPSAYCEEWWAEELKAKLNAKQPSLKEFINPPYKTPEFKTALKLSKQYKIPLHPKYVFFWNDITLKQLKLLVRALKKASINKEIELKFDGGLKETLEGLGVFHTIKDNKILIKEHSKPLLTSLNFNKKTKGKLEKEIETQSTHTKDILRIINSLAEVEIKDKAPTMIGARMGRPEKTKPRKMTPAPHVLFPTGALKGRIRNIVKIANEAKIEKPEIAKFRCSRCNTIEIFPKCPNCNSKTELLNLCPRCKRATTKDKCPTCGSQTTTSERREINVQELLDKASRKLNEEIPEEIKGIIGMTSKNKIPEVLEKGILRAKQNIYVFKDGTVRFDSTNAPLTHFKPREIGTSVNKLRELGYETDVDKKPLKKEDQLLALKPQDILLSEFGEESAASYLLRTSKFIDELLVKYYNLKPYYNAKDKKDLLGHLVIALAPHTSTGIVGRIIGFTKARVGFAHPCFHDAKRRDADGDEDTVMLLLDALLNFSKAFLPEKRGGRMDAPLVITTELNPLEIDDEVYDVDIVPSYGLGFYRSTEGKADPDEIKIKTFGDIVHDKDPFSSWSFTHQTSDINLGPLINTYTKGDMHEKLEKQLELAEKIRAVDEKDVAERIIQSHFLPDIKGNLRTFSRQKVRCTKCNAKYRRPPLAGKCARCGSNLTLTVHRGTIEKYLNVSKDMINKYKVSPYLGQQINFLDKSIDSIFGAGDQKTLEAFK